MSYRYVRLEVLSNHGRPDFTCVYRLRVHGVAVTAAAATTTAGQTNADRGGTSTAGEGGGGSVDGDQE